MIAGILLAAGRSQRMGQPKLLLPWHGQPLLRHVVEQILRSQLDELVVVLGHRAPHLRAAVAGMPVQIVENPRYLDGQSTSLHAGIDVIDPRAEAALVLLADQPLLQPGTIDRLIDVFRAERAPIVAPSCDGRRGNPVLFGRELFGELTAIQGDQGARQVVAAHAEALRLVDVADPGIHCDVDTPELFAAALALDGAAV